MKKWTIFNMIKPSLGIGLLVFCLACGEKKKIETEAQSTGAPASAETGYVNENAEYLAATAIKLRKDPSVNAPQIKCNTLWEGCERSDCNYETSVIDKGVVIKVRKRTDKKEEISGVPGYWYQISNEKCSAWVFGGFLKLIYSESAQIAPYTLKQMPEKVERMETKEKCKAVGMQVANDSQLLHAFRTGKMKVDKSEEGSETEFFHLTESGSIGLIDIKTGKAFLGFPSYTGHFACVK
jgi:hypothetical protein